MTEDGRQFKAVGRKGKAFREAAKDVGRVNRLNKSRNGGGSSRQKAMEGAAEWKTQKERMFLCVRPCNRGRVTDRAHGGRGRCVQHVNINAKSLKGFHPAETPVLLHSQAFIRATVKRDETRKCQIFMFGWTFHVITHQIFIVITFTFSKISASVLLISYIQTMPHMPFLLVQHCCINNRTLPLP